VFAFTTYNNSSLQIRKQYEPASHTPDPDAEVFTKEAHLSAIDEGQNLVFHATHGSQTGLVYGNGDVIGISDIELMENSTYPIIMTTGCNTGNLAYGSDTVGEAIVKQPEGGAIVFIGNTGYGSGFAGGMQLIDEITRNMLVASQTLLADALFAGYTNLPENDNFLFPFSVINPLLSDEEKEVVNPQTYRYTQTVTVALGDALIPVWNSPVDIVADVTISREAVDTYTDLVTIVLEEALQTTPILYAGGFYYGFDEPGLSYEVEVPGGEPVAIGFASSDQHQCFFTDIP